MGGVCLVTSCVRGGVGGGDSCISGCYFRFRQVGGGVGGGGVGGGDVGRVGG